ncbi:hypothetical protein Patl1_05789 [Pistacia atlantica]|uniref:Uncharacterized protein n=1 Tax=Pistacia atlantica TaxID=434234 RepID=A0ACC1BPS2_9ROSI|nr:hypothetical protein Patl1_05789 [Pistacia atlantica]
MDSVSFGSESKYGRPSIAKALLHCTNATPLGDIESRVGAAAAKQMLRMRNNKGNTALHEAVRNARLNVVEILTKEDPKFSYFGNDSGETLLYIVVERKCPLIAVKILETCKSAAHEGPDRKTTLHAAVMRHDLAAYIVDKDRKMTALHLAAGQGHANIMEAIIFQCLDCCELVDEMGWNFLHFHD